MFMCVLEEDREKANSSAVRNHTEITKEMKTERKRQMNTEGFPWPSWPF